MDIYQIYTQYLIRSYMALVDDNEQEFTKVNKHLIRIERMYQNPEQDNFYHYRKMVRGMFTYSKSNGWQCGKWM